MAFLAEVREAEADGPTHDIYEDLKRLGGVPMVALIFRHLATRPGVLPWAWSAVGPAWRTGRLQEAAWRIAREAPLVPLDPLDREALAAAGIDTVGEREVRDVLAAYNRANPENLLTVLCLLRLLAGSRSSVRVAVEDWSPPSPPGPLAPMADPATMAPAVASLLQLVADPGEEGGPRVVQSLYRHFAHRPEFLELAVRRVHARIADGSVARSASWIRERMDEEAAMLVRGLDAPPVPDANVAPVLRRFGERVIPGMIVAGALLGRALPP